MVRARDRPSRGGRRAARRARRRRAREHADRARAAGAGEPARRARGRGGGARRGRRAGDDRGRRGRRADRARRRGAGGDRAARRRDQGRRARPRAGGRAGDRRGDDGRLDGGARRAGRHRRVRDRRPGRRAPRRAGDVGRVRPPHDARADGNRRRVRGREVDPRRGRDARAARDAQPDRRRLPDRRVPRLLPERLRSSRAVAGRVARGGGFRDAGALVARYRRPRDRHRQPAAAAPAARPRAARPRAPREPRRRGRGGYRGAGRHAVPARPLPSGDRRGGPPGGRPAPGARPRGPPGGAGAGRGEPRGERPARAAQRGARRADRGRGRSGSVCVVRPVVVLGDLMVDVVARMTGPLAVGSDTPASVSYRPGGAGANVAAWLAVCGAPVTLVARAGDDDAGRGAVAKLRGHGVEVAGVAFVPDRATGTCVVLVAPDGERTMLPDAGANAALSPTDLADVFAGGAHLHLAGYALLRDGPPREAALEALRRARASGMTISLDPSSAAPLRAFGPERFVDLAGPVDLLLPNRDEAAVLGSLASRAREVVVTLGADGAVWTDGARQVAAPAVAAGPVADSTGAGDAFAAGFLAAWLDGTAPADALAAANAPAARAPARHG